LSSEVYLTGNYIGKTYMPSSVNVVDLIWVDQAPDQVPYNDESEEEDEYALDEVSSDVEMDPADMVGLPSDEDEDVGLVPGLLFIAPIRVDCITVQAFRGSRLRGRGRSRKISEAS